MIIHANYNLVAQSVKGTADLVLVGIPTSTADAKMEVDRDVF